MELVFVDQRVDDTQNILEGQLGIERGNLFILAMLPLRDYDRQVAAFYQRAFFNGTK